MFAPLAVNVAVSPSHMAVFDGSVKVGTRIEIVIVFAAVQVLEVWLPITV
jgi:hypothetical protein